MKMKIDKLQRLAITALSISIVVAIGVMPAVAAVSVTRDLPDTPVSPRDDVYVTLNQSGFLWNIGEVKETLPGGFKYVEGSSSGEEIPTYDEVTNELIIHFANETSITYLVEAGTAEQIADAVFSGKYFITDEDFKPIEGDVEGDTTLTLAELTPTPTATATPPSGNGGGDGGIPPTPPVGTPAYIALDANPADIPADGSSVSTITASVWDGEDWVLENLTVNFSTSLGSITASAVIANGTATVILTAGMEEGVATITAEANLPEVGIVNSTTMVNLTTPGATPTAAVVTPTPTVTITVSPTPAATVSPAPSPSPTKKPLFPGFETVFAIASLLSVAYLVMRGRKA